MTQLRLCSSREVMGALRRAGFYTPRRASGSHQAFRKVTPERTYSAVVPLGKREIPIGTLRSIIRQAGLTPEEFLKYLEGD